MSTQRLKWLEPHSPLPEMAWRDFVRLMQREFSIYALPSPKGPGARLVESPFNPAKGKSMYVVPDNRQDLISPKNLGAVLAKSELLDDFCDHYNRFFGLIQPGDLPFTS
jgi:hypothetical protein